MAFTDELFKVSVVESGDRFVVRAGDAEAPFDRDSVDSIRAPTAIVDADGRLILRGDTTPDDIPKSIRDPLTILRSRSAAGFLDLGAQQPAAKAIGHTLYGALFSGPVLAAFNDYRGRTPSPRIGLRLPREYYWPPWELLRAPNEKQPFSLFGSVFRYDAPSDAGPPPRPPNWKPRYVVPLEAPSTLTCLLVLPNPEDRPVPPFEPKKIASIEYVSVLPATLRQFLAALSSRQSRGMIFYGHGDVQVEAAPGAARDLSVLVFVKEEEQDEDLPSFITDPIDARVIAGEIFRSQGHPYLQFACVLACQSADAESGEAFSRSLAGALLEGTDLDFVVGAQLKIQHFAARAFLGSVLSALQAGKPLDLAITDGRMAVRRISSFRQGRQRSALDWWIPVLYARDGAELQIVSTKKDEFSTTTGAKAGGLGPLRPGDLAAMAAHLIRELLKSGEPAGVAAVLEEPAREGGMANERKGGVAQ